MALVMKKPVKHKRKVVALISPDNASGRAELRGVHDAARRFGWRLETVDIYFQGAEWPRINAEILAQADGIIARHIDTVSNGTLAALGVPLVGIDISIEPSSSGAGPAGKDYAPWITFSCDAAAVSRAAARELLATGREHFVFVAPPKRLTWTKAREKEFVKCIREAGRTIHRYRPTTEWDWVAERKSLTRWLARQPRPFGLFAANDQFSKFALEACLEAGLEVPRDVAVIGADNDDTYCLSVKPNLTSVRIDFEGAGRLAAQALERLMDETVSGVRPPQRSPASAPQRLPSRFARASAPRHPKYGILGVARRGSTRTGPPTGADPRLQDGLDYIAAHYGDPYVGVRDVAGSMGVKLRQAYRLFSTTGKSIRRHIEDARLEHAKELLSTTSDPISHIARACGFASSAYFCDFCRRLLGCSPSVWRDGGKGAVSR